MVQYLEENSLSDAQHGYRHGLCTVTQLITTFHNLFDAHNDRCKIDAVFVDFANAFDKVPHKKLRETS